jgi:hypothetical protein
MIGKAWDMATLETMRQFLGIKLGFDRDIHRDSAHMEILPWSSMATWPRSV